MIAIIVHGGCHDLPPSEAERTESQRSLNTYGEAGFSMLEKGASSLDVVEEVISLMEDDPFFDAGSGSFRNLRGEVEMDAIIMDSRSRCGGVLCIQEVQHPIKVARRVLETTPHILLSGRGAIDFARRCGFPPYDPTQGTVVVPEAEEKRKRMLSDIRYYSEVRGEDRDFSTVGVVALDEEGSLAAGTSTGGIRNKMPGRVGDSAIPGAGTYCTSQVGLSATGEGEGIMRLCLTHAIALAYGLSGDISDACRSEIRRGSSIDCICGVVALTAKGEFSYAHNGVFMPVYMNKKST